ncbi:MAG: cache domain-containing protein, partial [Burkholderiales bacterium]|nr:cache domain-containing protein [Burkholderiales bacterium]
MSPVAASSAAPRAGLRSWLWRLIAWCMAPLLALATLLALIELRHGFEANDRAAARQAEQSELALENGLAPAVQALRVLAASPWIDEPARWADLQRQLQGYQGVFGSPVLLGDDQGRMLMHSARPYGTALPPLPRPPGVAAVPTAIRSGRAAVGDAFTGPLTHRLEFALAVPVLRAGRSSLALLTVIDAARIQRIVDRLHLEPGASLVVRDSRGTVIAHRGAGGASGPAHHLALAGAPWSLDLQFPRSATVAPLLRTGLA